MTDKEFVDGLIIKMPHERAPDFVKFAISIKRKELGNWLRSKSDDWINIQVKESRAGKLYAEVDNWKPEQKAAPQQDFQKPASAEQGFDDDIPF